MCCTLNKSQITYTVALYQLQKKTKILKLSELSRRRQKKLLTRKMRRKKSASQKSAEKVRLLAEKVLNIRLRDLF
jgi:hypothetical protein